MRLSLRLEFVESDDMTIQYFETFTNFGIIQQQSTNNIEQKQLTYIDYWKNLVTKNKIYLQSNQEIPNYTSKFLCSNETGKYYESKDIKSEFQRKRWSKTCIKSQNKIVGIYRNRLGFHCA